MRFNSYHVSLLLKLVAKLYAVSYILLDFQNEVELNDEDADKIDSMVADINKMAGELKEMTISDGGWDDKE